MNKRTTIFLIVLCAFLFGYMYATNKMIIFNHSGKTIEKLVVESEFSKKELDSIPDGAEMKFTLFSPFDKKVHIKLSQPDQIRSATFKLQGFFLGENYNQVEIGNDAVIKTGSLGIKK